MSRVSKVKEFIREQKLDAVLISSVPNITYLTNFSSFSTNEREAYIFITESEQCIITDGRYSEAVTNHVPHFKLIERTIKNSLENIFRDLAKKHKIKKLGVEENNITIAEQKLLKKCFNDLNHFSISSLRSIKDFAEIEAIEKACALGDKTFDYVLNRIKKGVTEKVIAFKIEHFIKKAGADISFPPIVAFGKNSSIPHHQTGKTKLKNGDFVLLDFGAKLHNYCSDMTRTIFFGKTNEKQKKMYQTVLNAQQEAIKLLYHKLVYDTVKAKGIDKAARDYIISCGYPTIPHSLGHGIGLEVHELPSLSPNSKDQLNIGMVFSVEPGVYIKGFGGVRIEDLVVIESNGPRLLTKSKKDLIEL